MTQEELDALLIEWQERLRLQDWTVTAKIVRSRSLDSDDRSAQVSWVLNSRCATIEIMDPIDYPAHSEAWPQDIEESVVHELLHLHFAAIGDTFDDKDYRNTVLEQALCSIDAALVQAKRGNHVEIDRNLAGFPGKVEV